MNLKTFKRGVHPTYHKGLTQASSIEKAALPKRVVIPLQQHIGAPCESLVKKGDEVAEGQKIAEAGAFVTAPIHASISGKVKDIALHPYPGGGRVPSIIIEGDGTEKDWDAEAGEGLELDNLAADKIRSVIKESGIVGMGGAAFPTAVKLSPPGKANIDSVVLNGCECEPYLTTDHRQMVEEPDKVIWGLMAIMKAVGAKDGYIGIEDNKQDAIGSLEGAIKDASANINVVPLETKYPQGAEKMLIWAVLEREVPLGKLPLEVGVLVNNTGTAAAIFDALRKGKPLIERVVTVSGNGVANPKNLRVRIGSTFADLIEQCGGFIGYGEREVINGGPMMGVAQSSLDVPVVKGTSGITVLVGDEIKPLEYKACIRCAGCVEVCPMGLMPYRIADMGRLSVLDGFKEWDGPACVECGCCSFICPAKRPLVQWIRVGRVRLREAESASGD